MRKQRLNSKPQTGLIGELTFPDADNTPSLCLKSGACFAVADNVARELVCPEFDVGTGSRAEAASRVAVPEASVNEDNG